MLCKRSLSALGQTTRLVRPTRQARNAPQTVRGDQIHQPRNSSRTITSISEIERNDSSKIALSLVARRSRDRSSVSLFLLARVDNYRDFCSSEAAGAELHNPPLSSSPAHSALDSMWHRVRLTDVSCGMLRQIVCTGPRYERTLSSTISTALRYSLTPVKEIVGQIMIILPHLLLTLRTSAQVQPCATVEATSSIRMTCLPLDPRSIDVPEQ